MWQKKYLNLLEGNKRPRGEDTDVGDTKRRSESKSASTLEESSSNTLLFQPSSSSVRASTRKSSRNILESDTSSNSRASATRPDSSRRHTSSSTSAHTDRGRTKAVVDHPHLLRVVEMSDQGKRAVRADLGMSFDPWDPQITRHGQRLVTLALWKREVRDHQRYIPDYYSDRKAEYHRTSHDGNIKVGMKALRDFFQKSQEWTYQEGVSDLHEDFHNYHLRNHIPRVVCEYWLSGPAPTPASCPDPSRAVWLAAWLGLETPHPTCSIHPQKAADRDTKTKQTLIRASRLLQSNSSFTLPTSVTHNAPHVHCQRIPVVVASVVEAEYASAFGGGQVLVEFILTLINLGHPQQSPPLLFVDNECVIGLATSSVRPKKSKSIGMRLDWLKERASFFTKILPVYRHIAALPFLHGSHLIPYLFYTAPPSLSHLILTIAPVFAMQSSTGTPLP